MAAQGPDTRYWSFVDPLPRAAVQPAETQGLKGASRRLRPVPAERADRYAGRIAELFYT